MFGTLELRGIDAFDDGDELHEVGAELIAEIPVDLKPMLLVRVVYRAQDIATHTGLTQDVPTANHHRMRAAAGAVEPVGVVIWLGTVDRDTDEHVVGLEELCPLLVDQRAIAWTTCCPGRR